ncbi:hypothetical protein B0H63DRAFT_40827 [Podospora didyma]|uniref:Uncharacterized protein n=1 Tax=Podospora didyma TaxID=330526 RepID=A0AAE0P6F9_9PEZI|nr:hypothetical protein B0H63DRAFT_40827 [Podospora didyma]
MAKDGYHDMERQEAEEQEMNRACSPLGLFKSSFESISRCCWQSSSPDDEPLPPPPRAPLSSPLPEKKYVHVPTHAASSFLRTTTTKPIRKANEIL